MTTTRLDSFDKMFEDTFSNGPWKISSYGIDNGLEYSKEDSTDTESVYKMNVPGFRKQDLKIDLVSGSDGGRNSCLNIVGEKGKTKINHSYSVDHRKLDLDGDIKAECVDGVLLVRFKKLKKQEKEKQIRSIRVD